MAVEYQNRVVHRRMVYKNEGRDEEVKKKKRKGSAKYADRKLTCQKAGEKALELVARYTESAIIKRIPEDFRKENSITTINAKGRRHLNNKYADKMEELARSKQQKNLQSSRRTIMTLEQHHQQAKSLQTKHDANWNTREQQKVLADISKLLTKGTWSKMPVHILESELKLVVPAFWAKYKKKIKKLIKSHLLKAASNDDTWETNLGKFLSLVSAISDGKA